MRETVIALDPMDDTRANFQIVMRRFVVSRVKHLLQILALIITGDVAAGSGLLTSERVANYLSVCRNQVYLGH